MHEASSPLSVRLSQITPKRTSRHYAVAWRALGTPQTQNRIICVRSTAMTDTPTRAPSRRSGAAARISAVTFRDQPGRLIGEVKQCRWGHGGPSLPRASARPGRCPMATTSTSRAVATVELVFSSAERLALAGFLAGYTGLTRDAYALDLRQYASWCQQRHLRLFQARRADIECFARDLEARGRARATITRRLCTIAGFYRYAVEEELLDHSPAAHVRRPRLDYESHATGLDRNEIGALLVAAGLGSPAEHALISLLALNGLRVSEATGADIEAMGLERGHRTLTSRAKPARSSPSRSRRALPGRALRGADPPRRRWPAAGPARCGAHRPPGRAARRDRQASRAAHLEARVHRGFDAGVPLRDVQEAASHADPRTSMRYDRARTSLDRHPTYIVAWPEPARREAGPPSVQRAPHRMEAWLRLSRPYCPTAVLPSCHGSPQEALHLDAPRAGY